jgi:hypothetical protein
LSVNGRIACTLELSQTPGIGSLTSIVAIMLCIPESLLEEQELMVANTINDRESSANDFIVIELNKGLDKCFDFETIKLSKSN